MDSDGHSVEDQSDGVHGTEAYTPNPNISELRIKELKGLYRRVMLATGAPEGVWDYPAILPLLYGDQESNKKKSGRKVHSLQRTQRHPVEEQSDDSELEY